MGGNAVYWTVPNVRYQSCLDLPPGVEIVDDYCDRQATIPFALANRVNSGIREEQLLYKRAIRYSKCMCAANHTEGIL